MTPPHGSSDARFSAGRVLALSIRILGRHLVTFVVVVSAAVLPMVLWNSPIETTNAYFWRSLAEISASLVATAPVIIIALGDLNDEPASLKAALIRTAVKLPAIGGAALMIGVCVTLGLMFFVVPGLFFMTLLSVAIAAILEEDKSALDSITRSHSLVSGHVWAVFSVFFLAVLPVLVIAVSDHLALAAALESFEELTPSTLRVVVSAVVEVLSTALLATCSAALYVELRRKREGPKPDDLLDVFE